jgi:phosphoribosylformylglycinamidine cyclo-ligase
LPNKCDVIIKKGSWEMLPIFKLIQTKGGVSEDELYQVFNMGIGMVAIVSESRVKDILKFIHIQKHKAWEIGEVLAGSGKARVI